MIILQIDVDRVFTVPAECDPPVATRIDGVSALAAAKKPMKSIAGKIHLFRFFGFVECSQYAAGATDIRTLNFEASPVSANCRKALERNDRIIADNVREYLHYVK